MEITHTDSISQLPLSWARTNAARPAFNRVNLPYSAPSWIPTAEIPHGYSFDRVYREYLSSLQDGFVLQSCSLPLRDYLIQKGCQVAAMGAEAVLDLPWRGKRSVRELARRGRRHGTVLEVEFSSLNQKKLAQLIRDSPSRQGVQLRHTERSKFDDSTRCFVFETAAQEWMAAVTLSITGPNYVHTELLVRHQEAPVGIMEALINAIAQELAGEGVQHLSLGAVTPPPAACEAILAAHRHPNELWTRAQLAFRLERALKFAHNSEGLWRFKNKFTTRWEPLYLCGSPDLSWATIGGLIYETGYSDLVWSRLRDSLNDAVPALRIPFPRTEMLPPFRMGQIVQEISPRWNPTMRSREIQAKTCPIETFGLVLDTIRPRSAASPFQSNN